MRSLDDFLTEFGGLSDAAFLERFNEPFLLEVSEDKHRGVFPMVRFRVRIGRSPKADLQLKDPFVSNLQADVLPPQVAGGQWCVVEAGSTNGSYLDGRLLEPGGFNRLNDGAILEFGDRSLAFYHAPSFLRLIRQLQADGVGITPPPSDPDKRTRRTSRHLVKRDPELLRHLFDCLPDGALILRADGTVLSVNPAAEALLARTRVEVVGVQLSELLVDALPKLTELNDRTETLPARLRLPHGETRVVDVWVRPLPHGHHALILRDIDHRKQIEAELRRGEEALWQGQKAQALGRLAGSIAHDFNNYVSAMLGFGSLIELTLPPKHPGRKSLQALERAGQSAQDLVGQLLAFSRKQPMRTQVLDINEVVSHLEPMLRRLVGSGVDLRLYPFRRAVWVRADKTRLEQVIVNLVVNARDAMPDGGRLSISTTDVIVSEEFSAAHPNLHPGLYARITARDTGVGMSLETLQRLFEPFYTTKGAQGSGLGLATVRKFVTRSDGDILVSSDSVRGTRFDIYLPRVTVEHEVTSPTGRTTRLVRRPGMGSGQTILVVDDEEAVLSFTLQVLEASGYGVLSAMTQEDSLSVAEQHEGRIDLLLLDLAKPFPSSQETVAALSEARPEVRVLHLCQEVDLEGSGPILRDPFHPNALVAKVREVLQEP